MKVDGSYQAEPLVTCDSYSVPVPV